VIVKDGGNLRHEVGHPVAEEIRVNKLIALNPFASSCSQGLLGLGIVEKSI